VRAPALRTFHPVVAEWFRSALGEPTRAQSLAWPAIRRAESVLLLAPTGSGKTLAAFLDAIDRLVVAGAQTGCRVLYVSPLKALAVDIERNLRAPIEGISAIARTRALDLRIPSVDVRTGDTPASSRARMLRHPPDILITTPESLYLLLTSRARETLRTVETVIVDEIHALVPGKRGTHLFVSLERLEALRDGRPLQRIGLSATQRPLEEVARLLVGFDDTGTQRPVTVIDAGHRKPLDLSVQLPDVELGQTHAVAEADPARREVPGLWPHLHARIVELVLQHRSTLVFCNSRRLAERTAAALDSIAGREIALAHHGSVAREKRAQIEARLKAGELPAIVATSSLELGIDMGAIDLVVQLEAPGSVASGLQRIGRACHGVGGVPRGVLLPKHRGDLLACAAAGRALLAGEVEETSYPRNPLDVLAQQIVAIACERPIHVDALFALVRRAAPYAELPRAAFDGVLDMLAGRYPAEDFAGLRPRVVWDRAAGVVRAREGAARVAVTHGGTIPDRGLYGVFLAGPDGSAFGGRRVGELDEEMVFELRLGDVFLLGSSSWRAEAITHDRVIVAPAPGQPGRMPFWHGDRVGRSRLFGVLVGELASLIARLEPERAFATLTADYHLDASAARNLVDYVRQQLHAAGNVPGADTIVVERYTDEVGDWRVCVLSPFGSAVHVPWSMAVRRRLEERYGTADTHVTDDGMVFRLPAADHPPPVELFFPDSQTVERTVTEALPDTSLFAAAFRECAGRSLLLPKRSPARRTPLWAQRRRAGDLLANVSRYPSFPIVLEAYRQCLRDTLDLPGLVDVLQRVERKAIRVAAVDSVVPSPFAANVLFSFAAQFMYLDDAPPAERRAHALSIDHVRLRELLGDRELRELLDPEVIAHYERVLQGLEHPARSADSLHDLLLRVGDLSREEVAVRCDDPAHADAWIGSLSREGRALPIAIAGEDRWIAVEDAARARDGLGVELPSGLPDALTGSVEGPLRGIVARYAATHGPFSAASAATRLGLPERVVSSVLDDLVAASRLIDGAFLSDGQGTEYCDARVLQVLRARTLAHLRSQIEPVEADALGRFLLAWQGIGEARQGQDAVLQTVRLLEGLALPVSALEEDVLPARVAVYRPWDLDSLCASGQIEWVGIDALAGGDGRIALFCSEDERMPVPPPGHAEGGMAAAIRDRLAERGPAFFRDIVRDVGGYPGELLDALWSLVWAREVTNDTLEPLRSRLRANAQTHRRGRDPRRTPSPGLPGSEGRWSLRRASSTPLDPTEKATRLVRCLLERYGIIVREVADAEGVPGGFSAVYPVLRAMEESGAIRRGYFVRGHGGTQFALPGADERLRSVRDPDDDADAIVLAATDPASPWGSILPWPERQDPSLARPLRTAGARVILWQGSLVGWMPRSDPSLLTFLPEGPTGPVAARAMARALVRHAQRLRLPVLLIAAIDGAPAAEGETGRAFLEAGFVATGGGLMLKRRAQPA